ncbi:MAG: TVP38/TMEM64 family protein [Planctomycetota bacterium]
MKLGMNHKKLEVWGKFIALAAISAFAIFLIWFEETGRHFSPSALIDWVRSTAPYDELVFILICAIGIPLFLPDTAMNLVGALVFGPFLGTFYAWIGVFLGATWGYWFARLLGREFIEGMLGPKFNSFDERFRENGFRALLMIRLLPIMPFGIVSLAAGLTRIRTRDYLLATAIGILPVTFMHQFLFSQIGKTVLKNGITLRDFTDPSVLIPTVIYVVFLLISYWIAARTTPPEPVGSAAGQ